MLTGPNRSITKTQGDLILRILSREALGLALRAFFLVIGEAKITSPERVASQGEATALVLPLEANFAWPCKAFSSSEVRIASLLALGDALSLASRQKFLTLGAVNGSESESAMLLARIGAFVLASHVAGLVLPSSVVDASEATLASLLARSALALTSRDRRGVVRR